MLGAPTLLNAQSPNVNVFVKSVQTIADLRLETPEYDKQQFHVKEYHLGRGVGGGMFYYDSVDNSDDNGVTIFVTAGGHRIKRINTQSCSVFDAGAIGNNSENDTEAIQLALNVCGLVYFGSNDYAFKIQGTLEPRSCSVLVFNGARLQQHSPQTPLISLDGINNIEIYDAVFIGYGSDYGEGLKSNSMARGIDALNAYNIKIQGCKFYNFAYSSIFSRNCTHLRFVDNLIDASSVPLLSEEYRDCTGATIGGNNLIISGNEISNTAQGIIIVEGTKNFVVSNNLIHDIRIEHGFYLDAGLVDGVVSNNIIRNTFLDGIKFQFNDGSDTPKNVLITGNIIDTTLGGGNGISVNNTTENASKIFCENVNVVNNIVSGAKQYGISYRFSKNSIVKDNIINNSEYGCMIRKCTNVTFSNSINNIQRNGIHDDGTSTNIRLHNNILDSVGLSMDIVGGASSGIFSAGSSGLSIKDNRVTGSNTMQYALYIAGEDQSTIDIIDNYLTGSVEYSARFSDPSKPLKIFRDNYLENGTNYLYP